MRNLPSMLKRTAVATLLVAATPVLAESAPENLMTSYSSVHKVSHGIASNVNYASTSGYKWAQRSDSQQPTSESWAETSGHNANYKWASSNSHVQPSSATERTASSGLDFKWGESSVASETGYKWGFRSYADQAGYKWGFRSYADQAGYKWGFRSYADQTGYKWGFRSHAEQAGYKWGFR